MAPTIFKGTASNKYLLVNTNARQEHTVDAPKIEPPASSHTDSAIHGGALTEDDAAPTISGGGGH